MAIHDPSRKLSIIKDAVERLLRSRLCASTPAQYGYIAGLKGDSDWMENYLSQIKENNACLLYTSPSPRDLSTSRMPSSA